MEESMSSVNRYDMDTERYAGDCQRKKIKNKQTITTQSKYKLPDEAS